MDGDVSTSDGEPITLLPVQLYASFTRHFPKCVEFLKTYSGDLVGPEGPTIDFFPRDLFPGARRAGEGLPVDHDRPVRVDGGRVWDTLVGDHSVPESTCGCKARQNRKSDSQGIEESCSARRPSSIPLMMDRNLLSVNSGLRMLPGKVNIRSRVSGSSWSRFMVWVTLARVIPCRRAISA